jgi:hypothetical protein
MTQTSYGIVSYCAMIAIYLMRATAGGAATLLLLA